MAPLENLYSQYDQEVPNAYLMMPAMILQMNSISSRARMFFMVCNCFLLTNARADGYMSSEILGLIR